MNIKEFKEGDIITRNEPMTYEHNGARDGSYLGERITFLGCDDKSKILFLKFENDKEPYTMSYARDKWDEGWCFYPETLLQKVKKAFLTKK